MNKKRPHCLYKSSLLTICHLQLFDLYYNADISSMSIYMTLKICFYEFRNFYVTLHNIYIEFLKVQGYYFTYTYLTI
ncbi:hypothetical protein PAECIP111802_04272 [Paenibacillus allorhizosphaerae]|uniref:Uncharacterized protein n=1 Tax=Paenibacillus allorhizosphaerae TaxID=2849866 RepID=A0ABM8VLL0_9BACL|nr:hypothetical protein PAECIP111802_04272 [Paenibacillus allorhizosphaerae]